MTTESAELRDNLEEINCCRRVERADEVLADSDGNSTKVDDGDDHIELATEVKCFELSKSSNDSQTSDSAISTNSQCTSDANSQTSFSSADDEDSASASPEPSGDELLVHVRVEAEVGQQVAESEPASSAQDESISVAKQGLGAARQEQVSIPGSSSENLRQQQQHQHHLRPQRWCNNKHQRASSQILLSQQQGGGKHFVSHYELAPGMRTKPVIYYQDHHQQALQLHQAPYYNLIPHHQSHHPFPSLHCIAAQPANQHQPAIYTAAAHAATTTNVAPHLHHPSQSHYPTLTATGPPVPGSQYYPQHPVNEAHLQASLIYDQTHQAASATTSLLNYHHQATTSVNQPPPVFYYNPPYLSTPYHAGQPTIYPQHKPPHNDRPNYYGDYKTDREDCADQEAGNSNARADGEEVERDTGADGDVKPATDNQPCGRSVDANETSAINSDKADAPIKIDNDVRTTAMAIQQVSVAEARDKDATSTSGLSAPPADSAKIERFADKAEVYRRDSLRTALALAKKHSAEYPPLPSASTPPLAPQARKQVAAVKSPAATGASEAAAATTKTLTAATETAAAIAALNVSDACDSLNEEGEDGEVHQSSQAASLSDRDNERQASSANNNDEHQDFARYHSFSTPYYHQNQASQLASAANYQVAFQTNPRDHHNNHHHFQQQQHQHQYHSSTTNHSQQQQQPPYSAFVAGRQLMLPGAPIYGHRQQNLPAHQHFTQQQQQQQQPHSYQSNPSSAVHSPPIVYLTPQQQAAPLVTFIPAATDGSQVQGPPLVVEQSALQCYQQPPVVATYLYTNHRSPVSQLDSASHYYTAPMAPNPSLAMPAQLQYQHHAQYHPLAANQYQHMSSISPSHYTPPPPPRTQLTGPTRSHYPFAYEQNNNNTNSLTHLQQQQLHYYRLSHDSSSMMHYQRAYPHLGEVSYDLSMSDLYHHAGSVMIPTGAPVHFVPPGNQHHFRYAYNFISMLPIDAQPARTRQAYGMDKVWQDEFEQLFSQFSPSLVWTLIEAESNPSIRDSENILGYKGRYIVRADHSSCCLDDVDTGVGCDGSHVDEGEGQLEGAEFMSNKTDDEDEVDDKESLEGEALSTNSDNVGHKASSNEDADLSATAKACEVDSDCDSGAQVDSTSGFSGATGDASTSDSQEIEQEPSHGEEAAVAANEQEPKPETIDINRSSMANTNAGRKFPTRFRMFIDSAKVRFCCDHCGHGWTSMKGRVVFWYELFELVDIGPTGAESLADGSTMAATESSNLIGYCAYKLFGQQCDVCKIENRFERPMWYPEEVTKVLNNLYNKIGQIYFGFKMPAIDKQRRAGRPKTSHNSSLCQACHDGVCTDRK